MSLSVGERIRLRRLELNISQSELAKAAGMKHQTSISKIEQGQRGVPLHYINAIAEKLETTPDYLLGNTDNPELNKLPKFVTQFEDNNLAAISAFAVLLNAENREIAVSYLRFLYQEQIRKENSPDA